jgi:hypothetical protein
MNIKNIIIVLGVIGLAYYGYDRWKRRNNKIVKEGSFTIEVEPYEEPIK